VLSKEEEKKKGDDEDVWDKKEKKKNKWRATWPFSERATRVHL
jgi:hypothetical protein